MPPILLQLLPSALYAALARGGTRQQAAEALYPAALFLRWHYDTLGIAANPWVERLPHAASYALPGAMGPMSAMAGPSVPSGHTAPGRAVAAPGRPPLPAAPTDHSRRMTP